MKIGCLKVRLFEIFTSLEGEGILYGTKTLFVRLVDVTKQLKVDRDKMQQRGPTPKSKTLIITGILKEFELEQKI